MSKHKAFLDELNELCRKHKAVLLSSKDGLTFLQAQVDGDVKGIHWFDNANEYRLNSQGWGPKP